MSVAARRSLAVLVFALLPLVANAIMVVASLRPDGMFDFHSFYGAARAIVDGDLRAFAYPPPVALATVPLALLPYAVAAHIYMVVLLTGVALTLRVLGVRDWRCYGATLLCAPTVNVVGSGAISFFLALGVALLWRHRNDPRLAAPIVAITVIAKIFLWPLLLWLVATRRLTTAVAAGVGGVGVVLAAWAAIGFAGLVEYPRILSGMASTYEHDGYSPVSLALAVGFDRTAARAFAAAVGLALVVAMFAVARREDGDRRSLALALAASLALTPIVWLHYFVLLFVPIAIARPRLAALWIAPLLYWVGSGHSHGELATIVGVWAVTVAVVAGCLRSGRPGLAFAPRERRRSRDRLPQRHEAVSRPA